MGFPIQRSPDLSLFSGSPKLIAAYHVFHRLLAPRHPPYALSSLTINSKTTVVKIEVRVKVYFSTLALALALALTFNDDAIIPSSIFNCQRTSKKLEIFISDGMVELLTANPSSHPGGDERI